MACKEYFDIYKGCRVLYLETKEGGQPLRNDVIDHLSFASVIIISFCQG